MSDVRTFVIEGEIKKPMRSMPFRLRVKALKPEHARQMVYHELGSRHKAKRFEIKISKIEEESQSASV